MSGLPSPTVLRVVLVDDHAVVRTGCRRLMELEPDLRVVGEFGDADSALDWLQAQAPQAGAAAEVMVLDLSMPGRSGLDLLRRVALRWPSLRVLMFTMHDSSAMIQQTLAAGAHGFVAKSRSPDELIAAIRQVMRGRVVVSDAEPALPQDAPAHTQLSAREFDVMRLLVEGESLDEIGQRLCISPKTVANLQTLLRRKLGVNNNVELLRYAQMHRLFGA
ncbi:response regulator transcription factor [Ideonella paludis]|uniref:Response regulator transcription factor n=1 Tax=Ideonella paludis TaxID=1233411 RepID=A0ABS5DY30_9BURK|nr:response regulator transcription factor [Ideonella paludis]MBQ0936052.1 response regulator transcription factor [Ideonella paludis]